MSETISSVCPVAVSHTASFLDERSIKSRVVQDAYTNVYEHEAAIDQNGQNAYTASLAVLEVGRSADDFTDDTEEYDAVVNGLVKLMLYTKPTPWYR